MTSDRARERRALVALGSNLGAPRRNVEEAVHALADALGVSVICSPRYETPPMYVEDQPPFINAVARFPTELAPRELLDRILAVERRLGRTRTRRNGPRSIDLDLVACGDAVIDGAEVTVPHPRLAERAFVLVPLRDVEPAWRDPRTGRTIGELIADLPVADVAAVRCLEDSRLIAKPSVGARLHLASGMS